MQDKDTRTFKKFIKVPGEDDDIVDCNDVIKNICNVDTIYDTNNNPCDVGNTYCKLIKNINSGDNDTKVNKKWEASAKLCKIWSKNSMKGCSKNHPCMPVNTKMDVTCTPVREKPINPINCFQYKTSEQCNNNNNCNWLPGGESFGVKPHCILKSPTTEICALYDDCNSCASQGCGWCAIGIQDKDSNKCMWGGEHDRCQTFTYENQNCES